MDETLFPDLTQPLAHGASPDALRPLTIQQVWKTTFKENYSGNSQEVREKWRFYLDDHEYKSATLVGTVTSIDETGGKRRFWLEDGTQRIACTKWIPKDEDGEPLDSLEDSNHLLLKYVRVYGKPDKFNRSISMKIEDMKPIQDVHEVYFHILESIMTTMQYTRGPPPRVYDSPSARMSSQPVSLPAGPLATGPSSVGRTAPLAARPTSLSTDGTSSGGEGDSGSDAESSISRRRHRSPSSSSDSRESAYDPESQPMLPTSTGSATQHSAARRDISSFDQRLRHTGSSTPSAVSNPVSREPSPSTSPPVSASPSFSPSIMSASPPASASPSFSPSVLSPAPLYPISPESSPAASSASVNLHDEDLNDSPRSNRYSSDGTSDYHSLSDNSDGDEELEEFRRELGNLSAPPVHKHHSLCTCPDKPQNLTTPRATTSTTARNPPNRSLRPDPLFSSLSSLEKTIILHMYERHAAGEAEIGILSIAQAAQMSNPLAGTRVVGDAVDNLMNAHIIEETERGDLRISRSGPHYPSVERLQAMSSRTTIA